MHRLANAEHKVITLQGVGSGLLARFPDFTKNAENADNPHKDIKKPTSMQSKVVHQHQHQTV